MKKLFFSIFFLIFLSLATCTVLSEKIQEEMTLEVIAYEKNMSFSLFDAPKDWLFHDEDGSHLYEVYSGSGWESGQRTREIPLQGHEFLVNRKYYIVRGASRQPLNGELANLHFGRETGPSTYVAYYPNGVPKQNQMLFQAEIMEQSDHVLLLYQKSGTLPFTENRAKGSMIQLTAPQWQLYSLDDLEQLLNNTAHSLLAVTLLLAVAALGLVTCVLIFRPEHNRWLLVLNFILIPLLLAGLSQVLTGIDLPASLLPPKNIFLVSHYRDILGAIFTALDELASETTRFYRDLRASALQEGYRTMWIGCGIMGSITIAELIWHTGILKLKEK